MEIATSLDHQNNPTRSSSCCQPQQQRRGCRWVGLNVVAGALGLLVPLGVLGNNARQDGSFFLPFQAKATKPTSSSEAAAAERSKISIRSQHDNNNNVDMGMDLTTTPREKVLSPSNNSNHRRPPSKEWIAKHYFADLRLSSSSSSSPEEDFCLEEFPPQIPPINLTQEEFEFYHIGKAAGGTVNSRLRHYKIHKVQCHPNPTPCFEEQLEQHLLLLDPNNSSTTDMSTSTSTITDNEHENINTGETTTTSSNALRRQYRLVTIRDPIDRYVAAFEYTLATACKSLEEYNDPVIYCRKMNPLRTSIYAKYNEDPSLLGEALCENNNENENDSSFFKLNQTVIDQEFTQLKHLRADNFIHRWLGEHRTHVYPYYDWRSSLGSTYLYPLVVEKPYDLIQAIDEFIYYLGRVTLLEDDDDSSDILWSSYLGNLTLLPLRQYHAECFHRPSDGDDTEEENDDSKNRHSSTAVRGRPTLSERAQLCLARYYQRDYELLPDLLRLACKTDDCRGALQSIIDRRAPLLAKLPPLR